MMHPSAYKRFRSSLHNAMLNAKTGGGQEGGWLRIEQARSLIAYEGDLTDVETALDDLVRAGLAEHQMIDAAALYRARGMKPTRGVRMPSDAEEALACAVRIIAAQDKLMAAYRSGSARAPAGAIDTLTRLRPQLTAYLEAHPKEPTDGRK